jgi:solute carrier family 25 citrate transporter 1
MAAKSVEGNKGKKPPSAAVNLIGKMTLLGCADISLALMLTYDTAGGGAGMMEALVCHPLGMTIIQWYRVFQNHANNLPDTIKVRMQLSRRARAPGVS